MALQQVRAKIPRVKRALSLIRDHAAILRLKDQDAKERSAFDHSDFFSRFSAGAGALAGRRDRGEEDEQESVLIGAALNGRIALGAWVALLHGRTVSVSCTSTAEFGRAGLHISPCLGAGKCRHLSSRPKGSRQARVKIMP